MNRSITAALSACLASMACQAQDLIHYKFDSGCGMEVINYADGPSALPNGTMDSSNGMPWGAGNWGGALAGNPTAADFHRVNTGWVNPNVSGDFTMAFFMRGLRVPGASLTYMFGRAGSLRMFTGGVAGMGLVLRAVVTNGGSPGAADMALPSDIQTPAAAGWVHVALVVDSAAQTGTWYVNGMVDTVYNGVMGAQINQTGEVAFGTHAANTGSPYDIDELIISESAYSAADILVLSLGPRAADGRYSGGVAQCGATTLDGTGGLPALGNVTYGVELQSPRSGSFGIFLGVARCSLGGGVPLPFDLGTFLPAAAGCQLLVSPVFPTINGGIAGGPVTTILPISNDPAFEGLSLFLQAVVFDPTSGVVEASNGLAMSMGL